MKRTRFAQAQRVENYRLKVRVEAKALPSRNNEACRCLRRRVSLLHRFAVHHPSERLENKSIDSRPRSRVKWIIRLLAFLSLSGTDGRARFPAIRAKPSTGKLAWGSLPASILLPASPACRLQSHRGQLLHFLRSRGTRRKAVYNKSCLFIPILTER